MCAKHLILVILFDTLFDKQHYALLVYVMLCSKAMLGNSNWENGVVVLGVNARSGQRELVLRSSQIFRITSAK